MARKAKAGFTPGRAKNLVGVAKVVAPALIPVLAPVIARGAGVLSEQYDRYRARRLGVDVADIGRYSGYGARLHARIVGFSESLETLRATDSDWVSKTEARLAQLLAAVRASERMPTARRKAAHRAVGTDLEVLEQELLRRLNVR
ncbi:DUF6474 family protein [Lentzea flaviverrucosa]|uniref:Uncharacterized protein n=1 Tax=Lentzea flaviverrucosa TaxID=200379 RepID=A0A1H9XW09_9PSEU|nr:DUF6474 family protein [Lentzea flaviverrucosa]RDI18792.1 hypothetical protein DFR72_118120 [Lentzea flaviverrucosa]SES49863.1 hypothetical protein SAMN05216195_118114 [Lentzea flaviverrucosa]